MPILNGKARFAKVFEANRDFAFAEEGTSSEDGVYSIGVVITPEQAADFKKKNVTVKTDEQTGEEFVELKRYHTVVNRKTGQRETIGPPKVMNAALTAPVTDLIGNGSEVNVKYWMQEYGAGKTPKQALKLDEIQVVKLVPYEGAGQLKPIVADDNNEEKVA